MPAKVAVKHCLQEFAGTFLLTLLGIGSIPLLYQQASGAFLIAVCFGAAVFLSILLFGRSSGSVINPAISVALLADKKISGIRFLGYVIVQCLAAIAGSWLLMKFYGDISPAVTLPKAGHYISFLLEAGMTAAIVGLMKIVGYAKTGNTTNAVLFGLLIFMEAWLAGPLTGASMNPARSIGPAVISGQYDDLWLYVAAPFTGSLLAIYLCRWFVPGTK